MTCINTIGQSGIHLSDIKLTDIDLSDQAYRITRAGEDLSALALSISRLGMYTPPVLIETAKALAPPFVVVSGFRRLEAAASLNMDTVACRIFPETDRLACAGLAVAENAHVRELGPGELVRAVRLLARHMDAKSIAGQSQALFNTRLNERYASSLLNIFDLGQNVLDLLDRGQLAVKAAKMLTELPLSQAQAFMDLFSQIKASTGKQMEMLTWTKEIGAREKTDVEQILREEGLRTALDPDQVNRDLGAAANRVRAYLFARRFPELDQARKQTAQRVRDLKLPSHIRMALPENFESMVYTLTLNISSLDELDKSLDLLARLKSHPSFEQILDR